MANYFDFIKPTPMVFGAEGRRLMEQTRHPKPLDPKVLERMRHNYEMIKTNSERRMKQMQDDLYGSL